MLAPLSWLKEYIDITLDPKTLGEKLTEVGLGCERIIKKEGEIIFELEITPNRPDWLSIIGVAREIAAIENKPIRLPILKTDISKKPLHCLPLQFTTDYAISPRHTGIIIDKIKVKESPVWLQEKLKKIGQRPINNIVDITNYVMFELGNPLHAFDYNRIDGHLMRITQAKGGELFKSVDGISYHLPKDAVIVKDNKDIIDLCGIKGGYNSGTYNDTKTIFLWAPVENPVLIRKASQALGLRSEASSIFERGVNAGGTIDALRRCIDLILECAGGEIASPLYDLREKSFEPWTISLRLERLAFILGLSITEQEIINILKRLHLSPKVTKPGIITCNIPTYRNDLQIEEDLIEEVARLYGYNNFPKTLPIGEIPTEQVPYYKDFRLEEKVKNIFTATGFSEIYTYSLISEQELEDNNIDTNSVLRIDNPVSREYEYLRPSLKINLRKAVRQNRVESDDINLFELGKIYVGKNIDSYHELYHLAGISSKKSFAEVKGIIERLYQMLNIRQDPGEQIHIINEGVYFELDYTQLLTQIRTTKTYVPLPKYPPVIEDIALEAGSSAPISEIINIIKTESPLIRQVSLLDRYKNTLTFHIIYQDKENNLTREKVQILRKAFLKKLETKLAIRPK